MTEDASPVTTHRDQTYADWLGMGSVEAGNGVARSQLRAGPRHSHAGGVQGGVLMTFLDATMARAVGSVLDQGQRTTTIELKVNFVRPGRPGLLTATATVVNKGRRTAVVDGEVRDESGKVVCKGLGTWAIMEEA